MERDLKDQVKRAGPIWRWLLAPPGLVFRSVAIVLGLIMIGGEWLDRHFTTRPLFIIGIVIFACWWIIGLTWLASGVAAFRTGTLRRRWYRWLPGPLIVVFLVGTFDPEWHLEFWLSRPALEQWAREVASAPSRAPIGEPAWSFIEINNPKRIPGGVRFYNQYGGHWLDAHGVAYTSQSLPQHVPVNGTYYTRYCGNWYTFWDP